MVMVVLFWALVASSPAQAGSPAAAETPSVPTSIGTTTQDSELDRFLNRRTRTLNRRWWMGHNTQDMTRVLLIRLRNRGRVQSTCGATLIGFSALPLVFSLGIVASYHDNYANPYGNQFQLLKKGSHGWHWSPKKQWGIRKMHPGSWDFDLRGAFLGGVGLPAAVLLGVGISLMVGGNKLKARAMSGLEAEGLDPRIRKRDLLRLSVQPEIGLRKQGVKVAVAF